LCVISISFFIFPWLVVVGDLFRDLEKEWQDYSRSRQSEGDPSVPKDLWEELADIGEEFVEFLEMVRYRCCCCCCFEIVHSVSPLDVDGLVILPFYLRVLI